MTRSGRDRWTRIAAPVAFLAAVTIAVLLIRSGLRSSGGAATTPPPAQSVVRTGSGPTVAHKPKPKPKVFYTVQSGDTFGSIASKYGISVARLEQLNPGVSSNALGVGQKIRVK